MKGLLVFLALATSTAASATETQGKQPASADIHAFISAYRVIDSLQVALEEKTIFMTESGKLSPEVAQCMREKAPLDKINDAVAQVVLSSFDKPEQLREVTKFFSSRTGKKMMESNLIVYRDMLRRRLRGQPLPAAGVPTSFTNEDSQLIGNFDNSAAGKAFSIFVDSGLPQIQRLDLLKLAHDACRN